MKDDAYFEDKLVLSKANDTVYLSEKRLSPCFYGFLNEHQAQLIKNSFEHNEECSFWGGYKDAQRVVFGVNANGLEDFPIDTLEIVYKKEFKLSHRDFLGSFMALGIDRSTIGDILVFDGEAVVFVKSEITEFIKNELSKIGRVGVKVNSIDFTDIDYVSNFEMLNLTISSLRLDVIVSALCSLSRDKSQKMIKSDFVSINHIITNNVSAFLRVGDVITIRKFGKFVFTDDNGLSKKGKNKITVKHFR